MDIEKINGEMVASFRGQITQILYDTSNPNDPEWVLYRIIDGTGEIALFTERDLDFKVGDYIKVTEARTRKNEKGLSANLNSDSEFEKLSSIPKKLKDRLSPFPVLSLEKVKVKQKIQIPLKVAEIFPVQINKVESQKIRAIDISGRYNSIVLFGEEIREANKLKENEFFVFEGIVGSYNDTLQLNLGPDGKIIIGKKAWTTAAGKLYSSHVTRTNTEVKKIIIERKNLTYQLAGELCTDFDIPIISELVPRLATFLYYKLFKSKKFVDEYFTVLQQIESGDGKDSEIPKKYREYLKQQVMATYDAVRQQISEISNPKSFVSYFIEILYIFTIDLQNYLEISEIKD